MTTGDNACSPNLGDEDSVETGDGDRGSREADDPPRSGERKPEDRRLLRMMLDAINDDDEQRRESRLGIADVIEKRIEGGCDAPHVVILPQPELLRYLAHRLETVEESAWQLITVLAHIRGGGMEIRQWCENFENPAMEWFFTAGAGLDFDKGLARRGRGNAWVRNTSDWNAINIWRAVEPNSTYSAFAWLRLSPTLTDGYFSVRNDNENGPDGNFDVINELKLVGPGRPNPENAGYNPYEFDFDTGRNNRVLLYVGLWGVGPDAWIQVDEVSLSINEPR